MSEIFVKCVSDGQGVIIGLTAGDKIIVADDFDPRVWQLAAAGQNEAVAEALLLRRHKALESLFPNFIKSPSISDILLATYVDDGDQ